MRKRIRTICLSLLLLLLFFDLNYATNVHKIDADVTQEQMLKIIKDHIKIDSLLVGDQYLCRVYCTPFVFLPTGNCFIDWAELVKEPYDKETAYKEAIKKYSLDACNGTYDIHYLENQVQIFLKKIDSENFIATLFEYKDGKSTQVGIDNSNNDYWINAAIRAKELERIASTSIVRYYPASGSDAGPLPPK